MKIAIVNDLTLAREALRRVVCSVPGYEVLWTAKDGAEAVAKATQQLPDLVLMDLLMPVMDGVEATRQIMARAPCAILVVTATVSGNSAKVYEAMGHGALDAVNTPNLAEGLHSPGAEALLAKIHIIERLTRKRVRHDFRGLPKKAPALPRVGLPPLLAIGASTGGPSAIAEILSRLPASFPAAIVVIQHIDAVFADGLASWLNERCPLPVRLAAENSQPVAGVVEVAATNDHLILKSNLTLSYTSNPRALPYRPSVDVFFSSVVQWPRGSVIGVLLTGIGQDGARGLLELRNAGHHTIAQDEKSSVVYGMPRAGAELNAAVEILPVDKIAAAVQARLAASALSWERKTV